MPSTSLAQHRLMAMARTPKGRAALRASGKTPPPASVAEEFTHADKGKHFKVMHVKKRSK